MMRSGITYKDERVAGRQVVVRPRITTEVWHVIVPLSDGTFDELTITCESAKFGEALRAHNHTYDVTDANFDYLRKLKRA